MHVCSFFFFSVHLPQPVYRLTNLYFFLVRSFLPRLVSPLSSFLLFCSLFSSFLSRPILPLFLTFILLCPFLSMWLSYSSFSSLFISFFLQSSSNITFPFSSPNPFPSLHTLLLFLFLPSSFLLAFLLLSHSLSSFPCCSTALGSFTCHWSGN